MGDVRGRRAAAQAAGWAPFSWQRARQASLVATSPLRECARVRTCLMPFHRCGWHGDGAGTWTPPLPLQLDITLIELEGRLAELAALLPDLAAKLDRLQVWRGGRLC